MLAVVHQGGKQYALKKGQIIKVEKVEAETGTAIIMDQVKMIIAEDNRVFYNQGSVSAEVIEQKRDKKLIIFKKKRRKNYRRKNGHRQSITILKIQDIKF